MSTFWLIFHLALLTVAVVWAGRWVWQKIRDTFTPGL